MLSTTNQALGAAKWLAGTGVANTSDDDRLLMGCVSSGILKTPETSLPRLAP